MIKCEICNKKFSIFKSFCSHFGRMHGGVSKEHYYKNHISLDSIDICFCGNKLKLINFKEGFRTFCSNECRLKNLNDKIWNDEKFVKNQKKKMSKQSKAFWSNEENKRKTSKKIGEVVRDKLSKGISHTGEYTEERSSKQSEMMKVNWRSGVFKGVSAAMKEYWENNREAATKAVAYNATLGGRCKFYRVNGISIQGRYELYYILNNPNLKGSKSIRTPFGFYTPDFDNGMEFIEIKSKFTVKICFNGIQYKKIKWVRKNLKNVRIVILDEKTVNCFLKNVDLSQYVTIGVGKQRSKYTPRELITP